MSCFEVELGCSYGTAKEELQRALAELVEEERLCTYELFPSGRKSVEVRIYADDPSLLIERTSRCKPRGEPRYLGEATPGDSGVENLLDAVVTAAIRKIRPQLTKSGLRNIEVEKRTVLDAEGRLILFLSYTRRTHTIIEELRRKLKIKDLKSLRQNEELREEVFKRARRYLGKWVYAPYGRRYIKGLVTRIEKRFVGEEIIDDCSLGKIPLDKYWRRKRRVEVDGNEYPVFIVRVEGRELSYPPSVLRLVREAPRDPPQRVFEVVEKLIQELKPEVEALLSKLGVEGVELEPLRVGREEIVLKPNFFLKEDARRIRGIQRKTVELMYKKNGEDAPAPQSPLYALEQGGYKPYAGEQSINLVVVYPSTQRRDSIDDLVNMLKGKYSRLNLGNLDASEYVPYDYDPNNLTVSINSLEGVVAATAERVSRSRDLMLVVIPHVGRDEFYRVAKIEASKRGCHTQLVTTSTLEEILKGGEGAEGKLANICGGVYAEYLIQRRKAERRLVGPLTWKLSKPADGRGESVYVGLDVSTKRGVGGAAFVLFDPYGELVGAQILQLKSETITEENYEEIFRKIVPAAKERKLRRVVVLRDGPPRTRDELEGCRRAFERVLRDLECELSLEYISVIKRAHVRAFIVTEGEWGYSARNPLQGTYCYLCKMRHLGVAAHEVLVVSSRPRARKRGGKREEEVCTRPVILRIYELEGELSRDHARRVAEEYLSLTRLNFWNLETGAHKLALPVRMADTLARMIASGVPVRTE
jgi:hypothetical protein